MTWAAGVILISKNTRRFALALRSRFVSNPYTFSAIGGLVDKGETPKEAIIRESKEEFGLEINESDLIPLDKSEKIGLEYWLFAYFVEDEIKLIPQDNENLRVEWRYYDQWTHLHPKLKQCMDQKHMKQLFSNYSKSKTSHHVVMSGEEEMPYGVFIRIHKTTSTVFYNRKPFRKFRGNRHKEQAKAYAQYMEGKLAKDMGHFKFYAEEPEGYTCEACSANWQKSGLCPMCIIDGIVVCWDCCSREGGHPEFACSVCDGVGSRVNELPPNEGVIGADCISCDGIGIDEQAWNDALEKNAAETFEAEGKPTSVEVKKSTNDGKKLMAIFQDQEGKKIKTTHFGQRGASDYTKHGEKKRMQRYLERHGGGTTTSTKENWKDPTTAGALSRWILWNKPNLSGSFNDFKTRFNLKGGLKVTKSAEGKDNLEKKAYLESFIGIKIPWRVDYGDDVREYEDFVGHTVIWEDFDHYNHNPDIETGEWILTDKLIDRWVNYEGLINAHLLGWRHNSENYEAEDSVQRN